MAKITKTKEEIEQWIKESNFTISNYEIAMRLGVRIATYKSFQKRNKIEYNGNKSKKGRQFVPDDEVLKKNTECSPSTVKRVIGKYKNSNKCEDCGITNWEGKKLKFQLDHINGNRFDNRKENLRFLCPNCHSQTPTFQGKNRTYKKKKISDKDYIEALKESNSISKAFRRLGLTGAGNYRRAYQLIEKHDIKFVNCEKSNSYSRSETYNKR